MKRSTLWMAWLLLTVACGETMVTKPPVSEPAEAPRSRSHAGSTAKAEPQPLFDRDLCLAGRSPRDRATLVVAVDALKKRISEIPSSDRAEPTRHLADAYAELERADSAESMAARKRAIESYLALVGNHPSYGQMDEARYCLAFEYERAEDLRNARATYYDLIKKHPTSKYIPHAYLAFGELFFKEVSKDPSKRDLAVQAYGEVIKYPAPANTAYGYASYRLGQVLQQKSERTKAAEAFKKAIDAARGAGAQGLAEAAQREYEAVGERTVASSEPASADSTRADGESAAANVKANGATAQGAKVVSVEVIDPDEPKSATVRVGDTLEVTVPERTGTEWKVVGDKPTEVALVQGYLSPTVNGMKYVWKIAGSSGKRTIKFVGTNANAPKAAPQVVNVAVTVEAAPAATKKSEAEEEKCLKECAERNGWKGIGQCQTACEGR